MPDILRVTTPISGQDAASKIRPTGQDGVAQNQNINNIVDPSRVNKGDSKGLYDDSQTNKFSPNLKSNFETFLQRLQATPGMTQEIAKLFFTRYGSIVNSGMSEGIAGEMAKYLQMMNVSEDELLTLLKDMQGTSVKFTGDFFDVIRNMMNDKNLPMDAKHIIMDFVKRYDAITANTHSLTNILANLNNVADRMMRTPAGELRELMAQIDTTAGQGDVEANLAVLREKIIPHLSSYISATKDFGSVRDNISLFILNFTRYELGSREGFTEALNNLLGLPEVSDKLSNSMIGELVDSIFSGAGMEKATELQDQLVHILTEGIDGKAGYQNTQVFNNILQSALLNESVYMPLLHMMLPVVFEGRQMFSEIWVDPDSNEGSNELGKNAVKLMVKFDIRDLGFFELIMLIDDGKVDMQLYYPEALDADKQKIRESMFAIVERNDLKFRSYMADKFQAPKSVSEVFPKLYEGRNMINVTV